MPVELVVPISLTELLGQLHHSLKTYKLEGYPQPVRARFQLQLSALITRFLGDHSACIAAAAGDEWDCLTIVPSSRGRVGAHPLENVIRMSSFLAKYYRALLVPGPTHARHNQAADDAYAVTEDATDLRVLLLDDTFTSGARIQSAASALQLAGARVVAAVPIGRVVKPEFSAESAALLKAAREQPFDFGVCALE